MNNKGIIFASFVAFVLLTTSFGSASFAQESNSETTVIPLDTTIGLEKTIISMNIPENNSLPWGFVEGKISNHVEGYPVIIQIYDNNGQNIPGNNIGAVHFAQTEVDDNGSYEYQFRVKDVKEGQTIDIFNGDYTVKIFKVVYLNSDVNLA